MGVEFSRVWAWSSCVGVGLSHARVGVWSFGQVGGLHMGEEPEDLATNSKLLSI